LQKLQKLALVMSLKPIGSQDPRRPPANCGTHGVSCRYVISSINIRQNFMSELFIKFSFIHLMRFRIDNTRDGIPASFHEFQYDHWTGPN